MAEEVKAKVEAEVKEAKEPKAETETTRFQRHLQAIVYQISGKKVSRSVAWAMYKAFIEGSIQYVVNLPREEGKSRRLPLAGVGIIEIIEGKPRGLKAGLDKEGKPIPDAKAWPYVPRPRFRISSRLGTYVEFKDGLGNHTDVVEKPLGIFVPVEEEAKDEKKAKKAAKKEAPKAAVTKVATAAAVKPAEELL